MSYDIQSLCLEFIRLEWQKLKSFHSHKASIPPWGVWIRQHAPILYRWEEIDQGKPIQFTWFMDKDGIHKKDVWSYRRLITVNWQCPWAAPSFKPKRAVWGRPYHQIALAAFAKMKKENKVYIETQWGLLYGRGYQMRLNAHGELEKGKRLWRI